MKKKAGKDKKIKTPLIPPELTKLSYQKEKFVNAYLLDPNQTKAAKTAGYSEEREKYWISVDEEQGDPTRYSRGAGAIQR